jgi:hypothetical protein
MPMLAPARRSGLLTQDDQESDANPLQLTEDHTNRFVTGTLDDKKMEAEEKRRDHFNQATIDRLVALRLVMSSLKGLSFDEAAVVLEVKPDRLRRWLHEIESMPSGRESRVRTVLESVRLLHSVIQPAQTAWWFHLRIPALKEQTPLEAVAEGHLDQVVQLIRSYVDPSFA